MAWRADGSCALGTRSARSCSTCRVVGSGCGRASAGLHEGEPGHRNIPRPWRYPVRRSITSCVTPLARRGPGGNGMHLHRECAAGGNVGLDQDRRVLANRSHVDPGADPHIGATTRIAAEIGRVGDHRQLTGGRRIEPGNEDHPVPAALAGKRQYRTRRKIGVAIPGDFEARIALFTGSGKGTSPSS